MSVLVVGDNESALCVKFKPPDLADLAQCLDILPSNALVG